MTSSLKRAGLVLALVPLLSGCLAAVAIPLVAGGTIMARQKIRVHAATRPAHAKSPPPTTPLVTVLPAHELPPPSLAATGADSPPEPLAAKWREFFDFSLAAAQHDPTTPMQSALLVAGGALAAPDRQPCSTRFPAVVIDLDNGRTPFAPELAASAPQWAAEGLAKLRAAGVTVLWITQLPATRASEVADALKRSGVDPDGNDQLLLARSAGDRKQILRQDAEADVCVVAITGDRRGDFDELFDYLRDPADALGLYPMLGKGWFLVPPLLAPAGTATDSLPSWDDPVAE